MSKQKAIFNWSGGKDSALALYTLLHEKEYEVLSLLTSVSEKYQRVSMHGVRVDLLDIQAKSMGIPLQKMMLAESPSMEEYENNMRTILTQFKKMGAAACVFGDIFLEDLRAYREEKLCELDIKAVFPLWKRNTGELIQTFLDLGFKTIVTCVNDKYLDKSFAGRVIDQNFLNDLHDNVDPCGENGEFHTFVFDGPIFKKPIAFEKGELVYKRYQVKTSHENNTNSCSESQTNGFWFCDLIPV